MVAWRLSMIIIGVFPLILPGCAHCLKGNCGEACASPKIMPETVCGDAYPTTEVRPAGHFARNVGHMQDDTPPLPPPIIGQPPQLAQQEILPPPASSPLPSLPPEMKHEPFTYIPNHQSHCPPSIGCKVPASCLPNCCPDNPVLISLLAQTRQEVQCLSSEKQLLLQEKNAIQTSLQEQTCRLSVCEQHVHRLQQEKKEIEQSTLCELQNLKVERERLATRLDCLNQSICTLKECLQQKEWRLEQCQEQMRCQMQQNMQQMQIQCLTKDLLAEKDMKFKEVQLEGARQQALTAYAMMAVNKPCCPPSGPCGPVITDMSKTTVPAGPCPVTPFNTPMVTPTTTPVTDQAKAADQAKTDQAKVDQAKADQAKADQAKVDQAKVDQSKVDQAKVIDQAKSDLAKTDQAKSDQAKADQAKSDQAKADQSKSDQAKVDQSKVDQSKVDQAKLDQSKLDQSKIGGAAAAGGGGAAAAAGSGGSGGGGILGGILGLFL